jgi:hypothetical protein
MRKVATVKANSGHTIAIFKLDSLPEDHNHPANWGDYTNFYVAKNFDEDGVIFFYLAKGHKHSATQVHVWYRNKKMWHSFGLNFDEAINGAQKDGWLQAC